MPQSAGGGCTVMPLETYQLPDYRFSASFCDTIYTLRLTLFLFNTVRKPMQQVISLVRQSEQDHCGDLGVDGKYGKVR
jgi:hypothetical protein